MRWSRAVGTRVLAKLVRVALAGAMLAACRCGRASETVNPATDSAANRDAEATADGGDAGTPVSPVAIGTVQRVLFSSRGRLAFLEGNEAFAVVDTRSGAVRQYHGRPQTAQALGFDNRCDVSLRGYMPNVDIYSVRTDPDENVFIRTVGELELQRTTFREDSSRGTTLAVGQDATVHASVVTFIADDAEARAVAHGSDRMTTFADAPRDAYVIDSADPRSRSASIRYTETTADDGGTAAFLELGELGALATATRVRIPTAPGRLDPSATRVSFDRGLLVTVIETADDASVRRELLCVHDLGPTPSSRCVPFAMPSPFFRMLVSEDGSRVAFTERVIGRPAPGSKPREEDERDASRDVCNIHVLDRRTGKDVHWRTKCTTTTEEPLRFEGDLLVTEGADIARCHRSLLHRYEVTSGIRRSTTAGPPARDDVDDKLLAAVAKNKDGPMPYLQKQQLWPATYGHDELVTWSEGTEVLARRGGDLVLCHKRGGACGPPLAAIAPGAAGGASPDGAVLGAFSNGRFVAVDATSGAKRIDVAIKGANN